MLENILIRATNQIDAREHVVRLAVGGVVDTARADMLFAISEILPGNVASASWVLWKELAPRLRTVLRLLVDTQTQVMASAFIELNEAHQEALVKEFRAALPGLGIDGSPISLAERTKIFEFLIENKNFRQWVADSASAIGTVILRQMEMGANDNRNATRQLWQVVNKEMTALRQSHELCFTVFHAHFLRLNQAAFIDGFRTAASSGY